MAVDFFVMPFSKYIAGDFVTPIMQYAWDSRIPYTITTSNGRIQLPPGVPYGGAGAPMYRREIESLVATDLRAQKRLAEQGLWDEKSDFPGRFHRMLHREYAALLDLSEDRKRGFLGLRKDRGIREMSAGVFVPQYFAGLHEMNEPLQTTYASAPYVIERVQAARLNDELSNVVATFVSALRGVVETGYPMIVDF